MFNPPDWNANNQEFLPIAMTDLGLFGDGTETFIRNMARCAKENKRVTSITAGVNQFSKAVRVQLALTLAQNVRARIPRRRPGARRPVIRNLVYEPEVLQVDDFIEEMREEFEAWNEDAEEEGN